IGRSKSEPALRDEGAVRFPAGNRTRAGRSIVLSSRLHAHCEGMPARPTTRGIPMRLLTIVVLCLLALPVLADEQMLYVEYHVIQFDKSQARPSDLQTRKLWRVGTTYLRFE